jgi:succinate dehydrogenase flavin-adding protein (antitoxin of CptAB toxin-antitoxin module)
MKYFTYKTLIEETKKLSHKSIYIDGPRRCSTNYVKKSFLFITLNHLWLAFNSADENHSHSIFVSDGEYLHHKKIVHVVPLRDPQKSIVSSLVMYGYNGVDMEKDLKQYLFHEIRNFMTYFYLEKKYKNVICVPIEIFNNNENKIYDLIINKYNMVHKTQKLDKEKMIESFHSFEDYGENGLMRFHSYPIKEQESKEYKEKRLIFQNFADQHAKKLIDKMSEKYQLFLKTKREEFNILD